MDDSSTADASAAAAAADGVTPTLLAAYVSRDATAKAEEDVGALEFRVIRNDGQRQHMVWLTQAKNIFATQLPKMPREYIARLVFDRKHRTLLALKSERVVGGICFRPFLPQRFAEIAFLAITSAEQVKGYGTRVMNHLKEAVKLDGITHFLTYADNYAIGYFKKQGFTQVISMPPERWVGYIKDYDGGTLMECTIYHKVNYLDVPGMVRAQREAVLAAVAARAHAPVVHPGLDFSKQPAGGWLEHVESIPGYLEAGWRAESIGIRQLEKDRAGLASRLLAFTDMVVDYADAWPFREAVNVELVPEYSKMITEPMDLSTIRKRAADAYYSSVHHWLADFALMIRNCKRFNAPDTEYVSCANKLDAFVRARISQGAVAFGVAPAPAAPPAPVIVSSS